MSTFAFNPHAPSWQPEGSNSAIGVGGVLHDSAPTSSSPWTKHDGIDPPNTQALQENRNQQGAKLAYIRALKRATLHGMTWYRGQYMTPTQLGVKAQPWSSSEPVNIPTSPSIHLPGSHPSTNRRPSGKFRQNRPSFFSWNIGQLSLTKWDLFRLGFIANPLTVPVSRILDGSSPENRKINTSHTSTLLPTITEAVC